MTQDKEMTEEQRREVAAHHLRQLMRMAAREGEDLDDMMRRLECYRRALEAMEQAVPLPPADSWPASGTS